MTTSILRKILENSMFLIAGRLFSRGMQFLLFIYAARQLGAASYGIFSFAYATVSLFAISMDLGLYSLMVQQLSRDSDQGGALLPLAFRLKGLLIPFGLGAILVTGLILSRGDGAMTALAILGGAAALDSLTALFNAVFEARQEMKYPALIIAVSNAIMSVTGLGLLALSADVVVLCLVFAFGALLRCAFSCALVIRRFGRLKKPTFALPPFDLLRQALPFALVTIFVSIYYYIDTLILTAFCDVEVVGQYNAAYRLLEAPLFVIQAVTTALFPAASRFFGRDRAQLRDLTREVFEKAAAFGLSVAVVTACVADPLVVLLYGPDYRASGPILAVLIFSAALIMPSTVCGTTLRAMDRQGVSATVTGAGALLNVGLNLALIPSLAALGAAWATLATEAFVLSVYAALVWRSVGPLFSATFPARLALMALLWWIAAAVLRPLGLAALIAGAGVLFFPILMAGSILRFEDLRRMLRKRPAV